MVLKGQFRCDVCGIAEVETAYSWCDFCLDDFERWLAGEWEETKRVRQMQFQSYLKHEDFAYSNACN